MEDVCGRERKITSSTTSNRKQGEENPAGNRYSHCPPCSAGKYAILYYLP